jgi:triosephosphate isomerase
VRKPYVVGNWKMNLDRRTALELVAALRGHLEGRADVDAAVAPPFVYLDEVARALAGSSVTVGAQNMCDEPKGAFTGEISAAMLRDVGATFAILGHSERRHVYGESDDLVNAKVGAALTAGLDVILCIGETLAEREAGSTEPVCKRQLVAGLAGVDSADMGKVTIAYEPVWAIGTGHTATPEQASDVHVYVRGLVDGLYGSRVAERTRIQYGGSVNPANAGELLRVPDIDGALVGGAALKADTFVPILDFAR